MPQSNDRSYLDDTYLDEIAWGIDPPLFPSKRSKKEAKYLNSLIRFMARKTKKRYFNVLDIPCGTGRLDKYLREYGYKVYGMDNNQNFIARAKRENKSYSKNYIEADMRSFKLSQKFDVVLHWCASFGYHKDSQNLATLRNYSRHLNKGGLLILDVPNKSWYVANTVLDSWSVGYYPGALKLANTTITKSGGKTHLLFTIKVYEKNGKNLILKGSHNIPIRLYTNREVTSMLKQAGFEVRYRMRSMSLKQSTRFKFMIFVCVKS